MPASTTHNEPAVPVTLEALERAFHAKQPPPLADPVFARMQFPFRRTFYPLGFPVEVRTNREEVLELAAESWSSTTQLFDVQAIQIQAGVVGIGIKRQLQSQIAKVGEEPVCPPAPTYRIQENLFTLAADAENCGSCDLASGFCSLWLSPASLAHPGYVRYFFLEAAALTQIAALRATPVHGACIARDECGVLLCGDSGAGKSTLAYAAALAGWTYINDDASFILHDREDRKVVGNCRQARFRPEGEQIFPELHGLPVVQRADLSKPSLELDTATQAAVRSARTAQVDAIVFLNRRSPSLPQLVSYPKEIARGFMHQTLFSAGSRARQMRSIERLLGADVYELRYQDLDWAVEQLALLVT